MSRVTVVCAFAALWASYALAQQPPSPGTTVLPPPASTAGAAAPARPPLATNPLRSAGASEQVPTQPAPTAAVVPSEPAVSPEEMTRRTLQPVGQGTGFDVTLTPIIRVAYNPVSKQFVFTLFPDIGDLGTAAIALAVLGLLLHLRRVNLRRALVSVTVACAQPGTLAAHGDAIGTLAAHLDPIERRLARAKNRERVVARLPQGLLELVASGGLDPFFEVLETRGLTSRARAYPALREAAASSTTRGPVTGA